MKTQIALHSFAIASFEVAPVVLDWPLALEDAALGEDDNTIDWLAGLKRRPGPARRLPDFSPSFSWRPVSLETWKQ